MQAMDKNRTNAAFYCEFFGFAEDGMARKTQLFTASDIQRPLS